MADQHHGIKHPVIRSVVITLLVLHAISLVTWVTLRVFGENPPDIPAGTATALAAVYGLPALSYGIMRARRFGRSPRSFK